MLRASHPPRLHHTNNIWRGLQIMKVLTVQFPQPHITLSVININILLAPCSDTSLVHFSC